ncbi:MAG TPA: hypothetical protein VGA50_02300 [Kiloniellales bacterium]
MLRDSDVLIEFYRAGGHVKVSALGPTTYTEVCIVGDPAAGEEMLTRTALHKLKRALARMRPANRRR